MSETTKSAPKVGLTELLKRQQEELQDMYMDPAVRLKRDRERKEAEELAVLEEAARVAALPPEGMTEAEHAGAKALFDIFDMEKSGQIPENLMGSVLVKMGMEPTDQEIEDAKKEFDQDSDGFIDFREFAHMAQKLRQKAAERTNVQFHNLDPEELQRFHAEFEEADDDESGEIDSDELGAILKKLGFGEMQPEELDAVIAEYDRDGNGVLDFNEFISLSCRLRAMQSGDAEQVKHIQEQWLKKCSQNLKLAKRARQAAVAAGKKAFENGLAIDEALQVASSAACTTQATLRDIDIAVTHVREKFLGWVNTEMYKAAEKGSVEVVAECLRKGGSANWVHPDNRMTALMAGCQSNREGVVDILAGWHSTELDKICGSTAAVHFAAKHQNCTCLKSLLQVGANVKSFATKGIVPPLSVAAQFGNQQGCKLLYQFDAPTDAADFNGITALMAAVQKKQLRCATLIIVECKPDINAKNKRGDTVLDILIKSIRMHKGADDLKDVYQELIDFKELLQRNGAITGREEHIRQVEQKQAENEKKASAGVPSPMAISDKPTLEISVSSPSGTYATEGMLASSPALQSSTSLAEFNSGPKPKRKQMQLGQLRSPSNRRGSISNRMAGGRASPSKQLTNANRGGVAFPPIKGAGVSAAAGAPKSMADLRAELDAKIASVNADVGRTRGGRRAKGRTQGRAGRRAPGKSLYAR